MKFVSLLQCIFETNTGIFELLARGWAYWFEARVAPVLAKLADTSPEDKKKEKTFVDPFKTIEKDLLLYEIDPGHSLVLNKFCIVPYHLLIVTKDFIEQGTPLDHVDFKAIVSTIFKIAEPTVTFYNSGENSGASQPHKHIQVVPLLAELDDSPVAKLWMQSNPPLDQVFTCSELPFAHWGVRLDSKIMNPNGEHSATTSTTTDSHATDVAVETATLYLVEQYNKILVKLCEFWYDHVDTSKPNSTESSSSSSPMTNIDIAQTIKMSYNLILTRNAMILIPRSVRDYEGIPINSLAFAGLLLCKSEEQMDFVKNFGPLNTLAKTAYPISFNSKI
ncbi:5',5'''-P-1,P-4-tetraphosphate phosphorylase 2 [Zancudomyces culisetae]|uniref:5',5'''-P-1,P-4-tetraphosphate phosphorylase 2 n=1 Tax=Zancudomyces culisetae TaxID=1213189 RepID=A0A1R1PS42_ZANCU|nr:5',5'''-P-1,P-4-tetraphosphate phosphorylase 2 [Zancudomyces culisetae]|eukprot:OMH83806.1 5',5'''-P-1,P-4-tetraphosphate phosphorylase 2 [Zancudomyces culisetae]